MLSDSEPETVQGLRGMLDRHAVTVPSWEHGRDPSRPRRHWQDAREAVLETFAWGEAIGERLLGKPVRVIPTYRGLGWT
jgi:hypothetical protein